MMNIEKRLENAELAIMGLVSLVKQTFPPALQEDVDTLMSAYFHANQSLGMNPIFEFNQEE